MIEDALRDYYDTLTPSAKTEAALLTRVQAYKQSQRKRRAMIRLLVQSIGSAAACFTLAIGINAVRSGGNLHTAPHTASLFTEPSGYVIAGMLLLILITCFTVRCIRRIRGTQQ